MEDYQPRIMENREFVELEEEDIQKLNQSEADKFEQNPDLGRILALVEAELGDSGNWKEHWITIDASGRRVYARIFYTQDRALAVTSDGHIVREITYPPDEKRLLH